MFIGTQCHKATYCRASLRVFADCATNCPDKDFEVVTSPDRFGFHLIKFEKFQTHHFTYSTPIRHISLIMGLFQLAARLNNEGITALLAGNYETGVQAMLKSIEVIKQLIITSSADVQTESQLSSSDNIFIVEIPMKEGRRDTYTFNKAFELPESEEKTNLRDISTYGATVTFNSALAYQLLGDRASLAKAESLYQMALKLLEWQSFHPNICMGLIVKLAAINNLSQVHLDTKGDTYHCTVMATEAVQQVRSFVSMDRSCVGSDHGFCFEDNHEVFFEDPQVQGLLMNVLLLDTPHVAPAA